MSDSKRVVITGTGVVCPSGSSVAAYTDSLRQGRTNISNIASLGVSHSRSKIAGLIPDIKTIPNEARLHTLSQKCLDEALVKCKYHVSHGRFGMVFATAISTTLEMERAYSQNNSLQGDLVRFGTFAENAASTLDLRGPVLTVATGCTAGIDALTIAFNQIQQKRCDGMLVVAADATLSPIVFAAFDQIGALSKKNEDLYPSQPFGLDRDGFVLAEAASAIVLETIESATNRGCPILAEILSADSVSNAFHMTSMRTDGSDLIRLINKLLLAGDINTSHIDLIDTHGTSTKINDISEANAIRSVFYEKGYNPYITAQKAHTGHALGASNGVELVGLISMLSEQFIAGHPAAQLIDQSLRISAINATIENAKISYALKLSSSFSGIHSGAIIRNFVG